MRWASLLVVILAVACGGDPGASDEVDADPTGDRTDGGVNIDAGGADADPGGADADPASADAATADGMLPDAMSPDATPPDAMPPDATPSFTLDVTVGAGGTVTSDLGAIDCTSAGGTCSDSYDLGTVVTLTAAADLDFLFDGWSGDCSGTDTSVMVTMDAARSCTASFTGTTGEIQLVPPPVSVVPQVTEDADNILVFQEQADLTLGADLPFDAHVPSTYTNALQSPGAVAAGTRVNVYYLHFDPVGTGAVDKIGTITFPNQIIGLITVLSTLDATDPVVGRSDVTYPSPGTTDRDLEMSGQDQYTLSADRKTLSVDFRTSTVVDQIRIITLAPGETLPALSFNIDPISPPASVAQDQSEASGAIQLFAEQASVSLGSDLTVDSTTSRLFTAAGQATNDTIAAGTTVSSFLFHFDPPSTETVEASIRLDREILGLVFLDTNLDATDTLLGASGTTYEAGGTLDFANVDRLRFGTDRQSVWLRLRAGTGIDQVRVIVRD